MRLGAIFAVVITVVSVSVPACSGSVQLGDDGRGADASGEDAGSGDDGSGDASTGDVGSGGQDASAMDGEAGGCQGTASNCYGNDTSLCCGGWSGPASCLNGAWMCGSSLAPGCDGTICGTDDGGDGRDGGGCQGTNPNCFGNDLRATFLCCAPDPYGQASCVNGTWMCGSVPAPGCNTTASCFDGGIENICSSNAPPDGQACSYDGLQCGYDFGCIQCQCTSGRWSCNQLPCSDSGGPLCPSADPGNASCTEYQLVCDYKIGGGCETCECEPSGIWWCLGESCPPDGGP